MFKLLKSLTPPLSVTNPLTSAMQCWVRRKMVSSSNSPHIQHFGLNLKGKAQSTLRSVCYHCVCAYMCVFDCCHPQPSKQSFSLSQMSMFSMNPHPSDDISGTVCSILLSNGESDIKLENLTEMIEVQTTGELDIVLFHYSVVSFGSHQIERKGDNGSRPEHCTLHTQKIQLLVGSLGPVIAGLKKTEVRLSCYTSQWF